MEISKRVEKFIKENTRDSYYYDGCEVTHISFLTPDQAREAIEIAREEVIDRTLDFLKDKLYKNGYIGIIDLCEEYIKAMKDEEAR